jgi:hypothetical protein
MSATKCAQCGLVNFAEAIECRRCGAVLAHDGVSAPHEPTTSARRPGVIRRILVVVATCAVILFLFYTSLFASSEGLTSDQARDVNAAIALLSARGFSSDAAMLSRVASFRSTDNWWNSHVGHQKAWAATNFPFAVITLYPPFFDLAADDTERAAILLHEARHVIGAGEDAALADVWREKQRLGWTEDRYGTTRVFKNTREWTEKSAPEMFRCGSDGRSDCYP